MNGDRGHCLRNMRLEFVQGNNTSKAPRQQYLNDIVSLWNISSKAITHVRTISIVIFLLVPRTRRTGRPTSRRTTKDRTRRAGKTRHWRSLKSTKHLFQMRRRRIERNGRSRTDDSFHLHSVCHTRSDTLTERQLFSDDWIAVPKYKTSLRAKAERDSISRPDTNHHHHSALADTGVERQSLCHMITGFSAEFTLTSNHRLQWDNEHGCQANLCNSIPRSLPDEFTVKHFATGT
jgi:hypothetical protein